MTEMRRNLDFEQTVGHLERVDDLGVVVLRCCVDKGQGGCGCGFPPAGRMKGELQAQGPEAGIVKAFASCLDVNEKYEGKDLLNVCSGKGASQNS